MLAVEPQVARRYIRYTAAVLMPRGANAPCAQVLAALEVAKNEQRYNALLEPSTAATEVAPQAAPLVQKPGSAQS